MASWNAQRVGRSDDYIIRVDDGSRYFIEVANVYGKKNAHLIAAAPDLLEALKGLMHTVDRLDIREGVCCCGSDMEGHEAPMVCGHSPVDSGEYYHGRTIIAARAAISKAEGV